MDDGWLNRLIGATVAQRSEQHSRLDAFLSEPRAGVALAVWLAPEAGEPRPPLADVVSRLLQDVAALDGLLELQLNAILHHPEFQRLEASWRSLRWLVDSVPLEARVKVRVLNATWTELARDNERAIEFDQSQLFRKVYSAEFGTPGGEPFGMLVGDYYVSHRPRPDQRVDDLRTLRSVGQVAAAAFAPFVAGVHPSLLGCDSFRELELPLDLPRTFRGVEYVGWRALRDSEDARFVALTLPRVLVRGPYVHDPERRDGFCFTERCAEHEDYLWGNAGYALGNVVIGAFARWGWLADIRGTKRGEESGGLVRGLPAPDHGTDSAGVAVRFATEVVITDRRERVLGDLGLIPLSAIPGEDCAAFYTTASLHSPPRHSTPDAMINARLSSLMQYVLCASRIAHYLKVICRDVTGSLITSAELERKLNDWLRSITLSSDNASDELQARHPLREAGVSVRELPGRPGYFTSVIHICPHFQLDQMTSSIRLVTEIVTGR
jgi:type VI secretion system protein ImpD